jgi:hypothetical protein
MTVANLCLAIAHSIAANQGKSPDSANTSDIALGLSIAAVIVSVTLPLYLDNRQPPRVRVRISRITHFPQDGGAVPYYLIFAINSGRSGVGINQLNVSYIIKGKYYEVFVPFLDFSLGPGLPPPGNLGQPLHNLDPYSSVAFWVPMSQVNKSLGDVGKCKIYGSLNLSNGIRAVSRRGLSPEEKFRLPRRYPRLRRIRLYTFGQETIRWR